jgi:hypothetical protein
LNIAPKQVISFNDEQHPERSLLHLHQIYREKRREISSNRFYLRPLNGNSKKWYSNQVMGLHSLEQIVPTLCREAGFSGQFTMHSMRSSCATRLYGAGVNEQIIREITGHRSNALKTYQRTSNEQLQNASKIIQGQDNKIIIGNNTVCLNNKTLIPSTSSLDTSESVTVIQNPHKKMKIQACGQSNMVQITFE